jgi:hypothetical protein
VTNRPTNIVIMTVAPCLRRGEHLAAADLMDNMSYTHILKLAFSDPGRGDEKDKDTKTYAPPAPAESGEAEG